MKQEKEQLHCCLSDAGGFVHSMKLKSMSNEASVNGKVTHQ